MSLQTYLFFAQMFSAVFLSLSSQTQVSYLSSQVGSYMTVVITAIKTNNKYLRGDKGFYLFDNNSINLYL